MSFSISAGFKNVGHFFAKAAKAVSTGVADVVKFANKAQPLEPEVDALVGAIAGPIGVQISDLAFHTLGSVAAALEPVGVDAAAQASAAGVSISLDTQTILDIKAAAAQLEAIFKVLGATKPTATK